MDRRLAVYGTLAPGRSNHHELAELGGIWFDGTVRGRLVPEGWGATFGYPALSLDPEGASVAVQIFESADLPQHWQRLDDFEGPGYRRTAVEVAIDGGTVDAWIYAAAETAR
ncbi:gamma-glutamylcyclotransferase [Rhizorhabdus dicambivorans]|uniref:Gamma-glutamylcyclotransferase n=1 Tax=Rhizorhabdus dicambivorans TaxID=1850238 RepID=A0A2A4FX35_9SPHN|nr:gamma-glutamylcyclotransferase [Rhizorhabdus dicambivorans]PCE42276.1 gamma-glutamylcyclotransferase [Rhizorhabdus dicambivorans]